MNVFCKGDSTLASRTNLFGIIFQDCNGIGADNITIWFAIGDGIRCTGADSMSHFSKIDCQSCGSLASTDSISAPSSTYTSQVQTGSANSASQTSVLTVGSVPQELMDYLDTSVDGSTVRNAYIRIGGTLHAVLSYTNSTTITVWPWVDSATVNGTTIYYLFGAGFFSTGGDTSNFSIVNLSVSACGLGYACNSLYPATISSFTSQACGIAALIGYRTSGASLGFSIQSGYFETNHFDMVVASQAFCNFSILDNVAIDIAKCYRLYSADAAGIRQVTQLDESGIKADSGFTYNGVRRQHRASNGTIYMYAPEDVYAVGSTLSLTISDDSAYYDIFSRHAIKVHWYANTNGMTPTGSMTFIPPTGGTINGKAVDATQVFNTASGPQTFIVSRKDALTYFIESIAPSTVTKA